MEVAAALDHSLPAQSHSLVSVPGPLLQNHQTDSERSKGRFILPIAGELQLDISKTPSNLSHSVINSMTLRKNQEHSGVAHSFHQTRERQSSATQLLSVSAKPC